MLGYTVSFTRFSRTKLWFYPVSRDYDFLPVQIARALPARAILLAFETLFIPNCTRNHVITYTNN